MTYCPRCIKGKLGYDSPSRGILVWCKNCGLCLVDISSHKVDTKEVVSSNRNKEAGSWGDI